MSGGSMEYIGFRIEEAAGTVLEEARASQRALDSKDWEYFDDLNERYRKILIETYGDKPEYASKESLARGVVKRMWAAYRTLAEAAVYATRVEWLTSDDDGQGSFVGRVDQEIERVRKACEEEMGTGKG